MQGPVLTKRGWTARTLKIVLLSRKHGAMMAKKEDIDPDTLALIEWCTEVEGCLVAAGASLREAQGYIEEQAEWFTDQFYEGLTPQEAAKASLNEPRMTPNEN